MAISGGDGSIILTTQIDQTGLKRGMASMKSGVSSLSKSFKKIGAAIGVAFGVKALIDFGKQAVQLASDLQEVQNVVDVAFGDMAYKIESFSKTAIENFGISELTAKRTASTYMAMAKGIGIAADTGSDMAIQLTALSADMASFYNVSQEMADTALKSIFTGETETLKQYGIVMTEVNLEQFALSQGITKSISAMTQQEKTMLRYNFVLQQTALAQGDFARTSDSWANQTRVLTERWKEMQRQFGEAFMAIGTLVLPVINSIIDGLTQIAQYAKVAAQSIYKLFTGKEMSAQSTQAESDAINNSVENQNELTEAIKDTEKEQNNLEASFDKLNIISQDTGSNTETSAISGEIIDDSVVKNAEQTTKELDSVSKTYDKIIKKFLNIFKPLQEISFDNVINSFNNLIYALEPFKEFALEGLNWLWYDILVPMSTWTIENLIPAFLDLISSSLDFLSSVIEAVKPTLNWFWDELIVPMGKFVGDLFIDFLNLLTEAFTKLSDWAKENPEDVRLMFDIILSALAGLWVYNTGKNIINFISTLTKKFIEFGGISGLMKSLGTAINSPALAIVALTAAALFWVKNWSDIKSAFEGMSGWQKTITVVLGLAAAIAVLWTALSVGVAAAAILAGIAALGLGAGILAIGNANANKTTESSTKLKSIPSDSIVSNSVPSMKVGNFSIPKLAKGAVIPPNREFAAILGDNKKENEIVAPESTLEKIFKKALSEMSPSNSEASFTIMLDGDVLYKGVKKAESKRNGLQFSNPALAR